MKTEVWDKLPDEFLNKEGEIISAVLIYASNFIQSEGLSKKMPRTKAEQTKYLLSTTPTFSASHAAVYADFLLTAMKETTSETRQEWSNIWHGNPIFGIEQVFQLIEQTKLAYQRLSEIQDLKSRQFFEDFPVPKIRKKLKENAPQILFSMAMSSWFEKKCGRPCDSIVAALTQVIFNIEDSVAESATRARRRKPSGG